MIRKRYFVPLLVIVLVVSSFTVLGTRTANADSAVQSSCVLSSGTNTQQGTLGGAAYIIQVPANWNGTLVLYSHGYELPGTSNPA